MSNYNYPPGVTDNDVELPESASPENGNYFCPECGKHVFGGSAWVEGDEPGDYFCGKRCKQRYEHPDEDVL